MVLALAPVTAGRVRHESYLYPGFRAVVYLPTIQRQRRLQAHILAGLPIRSVVFAGCGFGDEMACLLENGLPSATDVVAIDIADVGVEVRASVDGIRAVSFFECDLLDLEELPGTDTFDLVQAGFVFHDLTDEEKDEGFGVAARMLNAGGYLLVSDFYPTRLSPEDLYRPFVEEADEEARAGRMPWSARAEFLGNGETPGLLRTIVEAEAGDRDFFDCPVAAVARAQRYGLRLVQMRINDLNHTLRVLLFQKLPEPL